MLESDPRYVFTMPIKTEEYEEDSPTSGLYVLIKFGFTAKYPDEAPVFELEEADNLTGEVRAEFEAFLKSQMEANLGMVMVFTVISAAIDWLSETFERLKESRLEAEKRRKEIEEEIERKRLEGTKVSFVI